jgi:hypothetical protein
MGEPARNEAHSREAPQRRFRSPGAYSPGPDSGRASAFVEQTAPGLPVRVAVRGTRTEKALARAQLGAAGQPGPSRAVVGRASSP